MGNSLLWRWIAVAAAAVASAWWVWFTTTPPTRTPAPLLIPDEDLRLGTCPAHETSVHLLHLTNGGDVPLTVRLTASCQCTGVEPHQFRIDPAETRSVALRIAPPPRNYAQFEWELRVELIARCEDDAGNKSNRLWKLVGRVARPVYVDPPVVAFSGPFEIVQDEPAARSLTIHSRVPLAEVRTSLEPDVGEVRVSRAGEQFLLEYRHRGVAFVGDFQAQMQVIPVTVHGETLPAVRVPVEGRVVPPYRLSPSEVVFPALTVGTRRTVSAVLLPLREVPCAVRLGTWEGEGLTVTLGPRPDEWSAQPLEVMVQLRSPGVHLWEVPVRIEPLIPGAEPVELKWPVRAYGVSPSELAAGR